MPQAASDATDPSRSDLRHSSTSPATDRADLPRDRLGCGRIAEITGQRTHLVLASLVVVGAVVGLWVGVRSDATTPLAPTATLSVDTHHLGTLFPVGAVGLSIEAHELSTDHLSVYHGRLVRLLQLLGPSVLRIGGDSVDLSWWTADNEAPPSWVTSTVTPTDLDALHRLLKATGWRVLLGLDLGHPEPARAADEAREAQRIIGSALLGVEIGNEPEDYDSYKDHLRPAGYDVDAYLTELEAYRQALNATAPGVKLYGPAVSQDSKWLAALGTHAQVFTGLTEHYYATGACPISSSSTDVPQPTAAELLSPSVRDAEDGTLAVLAQARVVTGRPTRIGETNTASCGGGAAVSPVFASALWALDWSLRAASSGVGGLNFHGGLGLCSADSYSPICASSGKSGGVTAAPEYYGLLAARQLEGGQFVKTVLTAPDPGTDLTTWATIAPGGTVRVVIDNLATAGLAQPVLISTPNYSAGAVSIERLAGPTVEARTDVSLGGASVTRSGRWRPKPVQLARLHKAIRVVVPPASAIIVALQQQRVGGR